MKSIKVLFLFFLFSYNYTATVIAQCTFVIKANTDHIYNTLVCGETAQIQSDILFYTGDETFKYKWTPSIGLNNDTIANPIATIFGNTTYTVTATTPSGCTASGSVNITVIPLILDTGNVEKNITAYYDSSIQLNTAYVNYTGNGTLRYKWTPSTGLNNDTIKNPTATVTHNITYIYTVTTPNGCTATDSVIITIVPMAKPQIGMVGVSSSNKNMIVWNKPVLNGIESYSIYKETNISNVYQKIGTVPYDSLSVFIDNQSFPDIQSNRYEMTILDGYGLESAHSNPHKTIHLSINKGLNTTWNLIWESYEGFTVSTYNIYRGTNANNLSLIGTTSGSSNQYSDISAPGGDVYYQMEVISPNAVNPSKVSTYLQKLKDSGNSHESSAESYNSSRSNIASNVVNGNNELVYDEGSSKINIIPNPVSDKFYVTGIEGTVTITVSDLSGRALISKEVTTNETVSVSSFSNGVYLVTIKSKYIKETEKLVIQH